jgi:acyl-CoA dehydrogenase
MGRSQIASRVFNCNAPDTGNAEIVVQFGTDEQKEQWLKPLLEGEIRSCFSMTEPDTSGPDPTGLRTMAVRDGDDYVREDRYFKPHLFQIAKVALSTSPILRQT